MSNPLAAVQPLNPERVAHRSIYGYLYQTALAVQAWIALEEDELLLVEGDEDFDRILLGEAGVERVATQVKSSSVEITTAAFRETITNFFLAFAHPDRRGQRQKFVLVTAATVHWGKRGPLAALAGWELSPTGEAADKLAGGVRDLLAGASPSLAEDRDSLAAGILWANEEPARWTRFVESVQLRLAQPDLDQLLKDAERLLRASGRTSGPPNQVVQGMLAHLLRASSNAETTLRTRSRRDLGALLERLGQEIAQWIVSDEARCLIASIDELPRLEKLLRDGTGVLPARKLTPGQILTAAYEIVPFDDRGREEEFALLRRWCEKTDDWSTANGPQSVWLMTGEGGAGKTRLFIEWCRRLRLEGWAAGFVPRETRLDDAPALTGGRHRRFLVIDYAETSSALVRGILSSLADQRDRKRTTPTIRVVLLSREVSDWWRNLNEAGTSNRAIHDLLADSPEPRKVRALGTSEEDRRRIFESASEVFAQFTGRPAPAQTAREFTSEDFGRPLYLHMAALAAVEGKVLSSASELLEWTHGRESKMWLQAIEDVHSSRDAQQDELKRVIPLAVLAITLVGGVGTKAAARDLITRAIPSEETPPYSASSVVKALHELYRGVDDGALYLAGLAPDLLAEYAVTQELRRLGSDAQPFLKSLFRGPDVDTAETALTILGRLSPDGLPLEQWIDAVLSEHFIERAPAALKAALSVAEHTAESPLGLVLARLLGTPGTSNLAYALWGKVPTGTVGLREVGLWITTALVENLPAVVSTSPELRAALLVEHGVRLGAVGRREDALEATKEATELYRRLAQQRPDAFLPDLATSLNNLGIRLSELGRREDALEATKEAVEIRRRLAQQRPDAFLPDLATSLNNLGNMLSELGRREDALEATKEATELYRRLAQQRPDAFLPYLAGSLNNLGNMLSELGRREDALEATKEATELYRRLAQQRPDAFLPYLAGSLNNLGNMLSELGRREDALEATKEATELYRRLAQQRPDAFLPDLATSLNNLGIRLSELGRREDALEATKEAVEIRRRLAQQRPDAFLPDLATSLNNLGNMLSELGRREDALEATKEATELYRRLAQQRPDAFLPYLAASLNNLGNMLSELGRREDALEATKEATELYRRLAQQRPDAFLPYLAGSLNNLGNMLSELGRREDALEATKEATELYRRLAQQRPDAFLPYLATSLNNLGNMLSELGRREDALEATKEATELYRRLAQQRPDAFLPYLAMSLNNLGNRLSELGRREDALEATKEATELYRRLAQQRPDAFLPDLATSLNNLGIRLSELGRREDALEATKEAVEIRRRLAQQRPDAFLPDLATSLNNLGNMLSELGRREDALEATKEAIEIRRRLAQQRPDAFSVGLAGSLASMGLRLRELDRIEEALSAAREAAIVITPFVERYRDAHGKWGMMMLRLYVEVCSALNQEPDVEVILPLAIALGITPEPE